MICIQVSASNEWESVKDICGIFPNDLKCEVYVEYFDHPINSVTCRFFKGGSSKTRSAAACQMAIDRWSPSLLIVIGTAGGVDEILQPLDIIICNRTGQYDVLERMGAQNPLFYGDFNVYFDNSWLRTDLYQTIIKEGFIATADQDVGINQVQILREHGVAVADWESGAIALICRLNGVKCCILRGVSDIPKAHPVDGENQQNADFVKNTPLVMKKIIKEILPIILVEFTNLSLKSGVKGLSTEL